MDPVKGNITEPMSMVQYLYVVDNPLKWLDPLGLMEMDNVNSNGIALDVPGLPLETELVATQGNRKLHENYSPRSTILATIPYRGSVFSQNEAKQNDGTTWYKVSFWGQIGWVDANYFQEKKGVKC